MEGMEFPQEDEVGEEESVETKIEERELTMQNAVGIHQKYHYML